MSFLSVGHSFLLVGLPFLLMGYPVLLVGHFLKMFSSRISLPCRPNIPPISGLIVFSVSLVVCTVIFSVIIPCWITISRLSYLNLAVTPNQPEQKPTGTNSEYVTGRLDLTPNLTGRLAFFEFMYRFYQFVLYLRSFEVI